MSVETTVIQTADSFAQIQYALVLEFRGKLKEHAETFDASKLPQLNQELQTLQMQLNEVQMLRDRTLQIGKQKEDIRASLADVAALLNPRMGRIPYMSMQALGETILESMCGEIGYLNTADDKTLNGITEFAVSILREHHPRIYQLVLNEGVDTSDKMRKFLTAVIQQQL